MSTNFSIYGTDLFGNPIEDKPRGKIADEFLVPPFSVLNAREGWWQDRKNAWISQGIRSEIGRDAVTCQIGDKSTWDSGKNQDSRQCADRRSNLNGAPPKPEWATGTGTTNMAPGTSIFDPTLTELCYRWFCPPGGQVLDPFAGGSVRGIVASMLGYRYWGCDLRQEQIDANRKQGAAICGDNHPKWVCGDSTEMAGNAPDADFIFSCPPYGDLERYSDDPRDLSAMDYHAFIFAMRRIVLACSERLKPNRFACFVVGDFRDKRTGFYRNFVSDTIDSFKRCGLELYNEAILVTSVGSLPIRITKQFEASRKLGKTHQNVLVFIKGDPREAARSCQANQVK